MKEQIKQYIEGELRSQGDRLKLHDEDDLVAIGLDSIGFLRLVDYIETSRGVKIPPESVTIENFGSIAKIAVFVGELEAQ